MEDILMALVTVEDGNVCIVRAEEVGKALIALHGAPKHGLKVKARIEYAFRSAADVAEMEEFDKAGLDHSRVI